MKRLVYIMVAIMAITLAKPTSLEAKRKLVPRMYMFGFAASFNDSIVHFTDVMEVDSAYIDTKYGFLMGREFYSAQLRNYMTHQLQMPHRTCLVVYNKKREKVEKEFIKFKRLYTNSKDGSQVNDVRYIEQKDFRFKGVNLSDGEDDESQSPTTGNKD